MSVTRYDMDFDDDVLYCYEIQLEESCRGKGLGKFMMKVLRQGEKEKFYHIFLKSHRYLLAPGVGAAHHPGWLVENHAHSVQA